MASKIRVDQIQTADGTGTIALQNQLSGMTSASMPAGSVLQVVTASGIPSGYTSITKNTDTVAALYGVSTANRAYATLATVNITPVRTNSKFYVWTNVGMGGSTHSNRGAFGIILVKDNTTGYDRSNYPYYQASVSMQNYGIDQSQHHVIPTTGSLAAITFDLKGYAYNEGSGSASQIVSFRLAQITVMEIAG